MTGTDCWSCDIGFSEATGIRLLHFDLLLTKMLFSARKVLACRFLLRDIDSIDLSKLMRSDLTKSSCQHRIDNSCLSSYRMLELNNKHSLSPLCCTISNSTHRYPQTSWHGHTNLSPTSEDAAKNSLQKMSSPITPEMKDQVRPLHS